jgi:hypothetical protein
MSVSRSEGSTSVIVADGVCFTSFSFNTGSFLPIEGLNTPLPFEKNSKVFIEINMLRNLQPSGSAIIKCEPVGPESNSWTNYPELFTIRPQDEYDENGRVVKLVDGKSQTKCYALIGYAINDANKNGVENDSGEGEGEEAIGLIQLLNTNIILLASAVSGVAVVFPAPYFDGHTHKQACETS